MVAPYHCLVLRTSDASIIASEFGLGDHASLEGPVARGEVGQVWRLTTDAGAWAVKEPFELPSPTEAEDDAAFQDAVRSAGIPMPAVVRTVSGSVICEVDSTAVRVYEWVDLLERDPSVDPAQIGRLVASIHGVRHLGRNPVHWWYTDPVGAVAWDELIGDLTAARAPFVAQMADLRDELVALEGLFEFPTNLQTCHRDLFADNVLTTSTGGLCVIDWENAGLADPSQELGLVLYDFSQGDPARARNLYETYVDAGGPGRIRRPQDFTMVIAQLGHIGQISCRDWLDPSQRSQQARNAGRVEEFVSAPITRQMIESFMDALG